MENPTTAQNFANILQPHCAQYLTPRPNKSVKTPKISTKRENKSKKLHSEGGELAQTGSQSSTFFCMSTAVPKEVVGIFVVVVLVSVVGVVAFLLVVFAAVPKEVVGN